MMELWIEYSKRICGRLYRDASSGLVWKGMKLIFHEATLMNYGGIPLWLSNYSDQRS
jgi:hypothetical protein